MSQTEEHHYSLECLLVKLVYLALKNHTWEERFFRVMNTIVLERKFIAILTENKGFADFFGEF